jgi:hypothetical protein
LGTKGKEGKKKMKKEKEKEGKKKMTYAVSIMIVPHSTQINTA